MVLWRGGVSITARTLAEKAAPMCAFGPLAMAPTCFAASH